MNIKRLLSSKLVFILLLALLAFLTNIKFRQWQSQKAIDREKQNLIKQTQELEQKNAELKDSLANLNSDAFKDKVAKQNNFKREGEEVYSFIDAPDNPLNQSSALDGNQNKSNAEKWLEYFTKSY